ncbi:MAG TPA: PAS domain-containing protein [Gammaproteobacteria bacterium]|nr:PAS domain-containing protein [Gammaproteobacteria bacterium]
MKPKVQPTGIEIPISESHLIVSKTDTKGRIVYANKVLIDVTGYREEELLGVQHNIIRHPKMPRGMFKILWDYIRDGREYNGFIMNLCKNGSFYWVYTNVTPSHDSSGNLIGYYSARRKCNRDALQVIEPLYRDMLNAENQAGAKAAIDASMNVLNGLLADKGVSYDELVCTLQH